MLLYGFCASAERSGWDHGIKLVLKRGVVLLDLIAVKIVTAGMFVGSADRRWSMCCWLFVDEGFVVFLGCGEGG